MGIVYSKSDRTFTIQTKNTTYQMQVDPYGFLLHIMSDFVTLSAIRFEVNQ